MNEREHDFSRSGAQAIELRKLASLPITFLAVFKDGSIYEQTPEDQSKTRADKSAWFDVLERGLENVLRLELVGRSPHTGRRVNLSVDLRDGHFEVNGIEVVLGRQLPPRVARTTPVYFRQRRIHTEVTATVQKDMSIEVTDKPAGEDTRFCIGWCAELPDGTKREEILSTF